MMHTSNLCLDLNADFRDVTSRSVFPDLLPFESNVFLPSQRRVRLVLAMVGASCRGFMSSLPQIDFFALSAMLLLAIA